MKQKITLSLMLLLLNVFAAINLFAQEVPPLVYPIENTGASFPKPVMIDNLDELPFIQQLPDPFAWSDGSGRSTDFADWEHRRNEIKAMIEHYEIGIKPDRPEDITASFADNVLTVNITVNGETLTITSDVTLPTEGAGPFPAVIGIGSGSGSLPSDIFSSRNIAQIAFNFSQVMAHQQSRGDEPINKLYPELTYMGAYSAWSWGISRLIDGIELALSDKIDLSHLAVTGCSFAGKMALFAGAFDERIALTISQESGGGGYTSWRVSETLGSVENLGATDYHWFIEDMRKFAGNNVPRLPVDHHELMAMVVPRALLVLGNKDFTWLADPSGYVASRAVQKVYETFGIGDRFGLSNVGGHGHCALPDIERPVVTAFVEKFLLGDQTANTSVFTHPYGEMNYAFWMSAWSGDPELPPVELEETWREAESECSTIGSAFSTVDDANVSNGKYLTTSSSSIEAVPEESGLISIPFAVKNYGKFYIYFRLNSLNAASDSYWLNIDNRPFVKLEGLSTNGDWKWLLVATEDILAGKHILTIGSCESGSKLDRIYITNRAELPVGLGGLESECLKTVTRTFFDFESGDIEGWTRQNPGAGIDITQEDSHDGDYALKMVNGFGTNAWNVQAFTPAIEIVPGHEYKVSFWIRSLGGEGRGRVSTVSSNQLGDQYWSDFDVPAEWIEVVYPDLVASGNLMQLSFDLGYVANATYYIDDILIEDVTAPSSIIKISIVEGYHLGESYPNPVLDRSLISFELPVSSQVSLKLYNLSGIEVLELASGVYPAGKSSIEFSVRDLPSGLYIYTLCVGEFTSSKKLIIKRD
jgi:hypothetical protein